MIKELKQSLGEHLKLAQDIQKEYAGKYNEMPAEKAAEFDRITDVCDSLQKQIESAEKLEKVNKWANAPSDEVPIAEATKGTSPAVEDDEKVRESAFIKRLLMGSAAQKAYTDAELKAVQADNWATGGFITAPQQMASTILKNVDNLLFMRQNGTVIPTGSEGLGIPMMITDVDDAEWTSEIGTSNTTEWAGGKRELKPHDIKKALLISTKLIRNARIDIASYLMARIAYKIAAPMENKFLNGNGVNQPLGLFTASADGISTARDVPAASSTVIAADDLVNMMYSLKQQYMSKATWMFHRDAIKQIRKLKTTNGDYIWNPMGLVGHGIQAGSPGEILGRPYQMSEYAPNTFTTGLYVGLLGDFSTYWIADEGSVRIQVLNELYARTSQVGYHVEAATDGAPVLEEAFARLKMA